VASGLIKISLYKVSDNSGKEGFCRLLFWENPGRITSVITNENALIAFIRFTDLVCS
jgi:hypothetical protein